jgi:ankyrin repeat protein
MEVTLSISDFVTRKQEISTWIINRWSFGRQNGTTYDDLKQIIMANLDSQFTITIEYRENLELFGLATLVPMSRLTSDEDILSECINNDDIGFFLQYNYLFGNHQNYFLHFAIDLNRVDMVKTMLEFSNVDPSDKDNLAIRLAAENGYSDMVELLLQDERVDPTANSNYALRVACHKQHHRVVRQLLKDSRVDPTLYDGLTLQLADDNYKVLVELLKDDRFDTSLVIDVATKNKIHVILRQYITKNVKKQEIFAKACEYADESIVYELLGDADVDPAHNDNYGLGIACEKGHFMTVNMLLNDVRVSPSADDNYPIRLAAAYKHSGIVARLLLEDDVDPSDKDNYALRIAITNDDELTARELNESGKLHDVDADTDAALKELLKIQPCVLCDSDIKSSLALACSHFVCASCLPSLRHNICPVCRDVLAGPLVTPSVVASIRQNEDEDRNEREAEALRIAMLAANGVNVNEMYGL